MGDSYHIAIAYYLREKVSCFSQITPQPQKFYGELLHINTRKACKSWYLQKFLGNEGEDVKQQNFFIVNNKQYMIFVTAIHKLHMYMLGMSGTVIF